MQQNVQIRRIHVWLFLEANDLFAYLEADTSSGSDEEGDNIANPGDETENLENVNEERGRGLFYVKRT